MTLEAYAKKRGSVVRRARPSRTSSSTVELTGDGVTIELQVVPDHGSPTVEPDAALTVLSSALAEPYVTLAAATQSVTTANVLPAAECSSHGGTEEEVETRTSRAATCGVGAGRRQLCVYRHQRQALWAHDTRSKSITRYHLRRAARRRC